MKQIVKRLKADLNGELYRKFRAYRLRGISLRSTIISRWNGWLKGITIGKNTKFYGVPYFNRFPQSTVQIGENCTINSNFIYNLIGINRRTIIATFTGSSKIIIGNNVGLSGTSITASKEVIIGNNVLCGANTTITDFDWHPLAADMRHETGASESSPVIIEDNVWLGLNVTVLKGVRIGKNSIIGADSLVVKDIPPNVVAGGVPCKVLRSL
jgi:acetyltransferase-like isoleucine patch superfamily enzyme